MKNKLKIILSYVLFCFFTLTGAILFIVAHKISTAFGQVSLDQILFHLSLPLDTVDPQIIEGLLTLDLFSGIVLSVAVFACLALIPFLFIKNFAVFRAERILFISCLVSVWFLILPLIRISVENHVFHSIAAMFLKSTIIDENYSAHSIDEFQQIGADGKELVQKDKPNLILIVSESLENTFSNAQIFHCDLLKELSGIRERGEYIDRLYSVYGTHYTIASMYAVHYGLPLLFLDCHSGSPLQKNIFRKNCISIFDVFEENGYSICHLQGSL